MSSLPHSDETDGTALLSSVELSSAHPPVDAHDILSHEDHSSAPDVGNLPHGRSPKRRLWTILVVLIIIGVVSLFIWFYPAIVRHVFIPALDWSSRVFTRAQLALLLMALMTLLPLIWPFSAPVLWVTAMTFGWGWGALLLTLGTAGGMALPFLVARRWLAGTVQAWLATKRTVGALVAAAENQAPFWGILLLRLSPAPFMAINYAAGVTTIPFRVYMAASMLGEIPGHILALYTGVTSHDLIELSEQKRAPSALSVAVFLLGLSATILIVVTASLYAKRAMERMVAADQLAHATGDQLAHATTDQLAQTTIGPASTRQALVVPANDLVATEKIQLVDKERHPPGYE